MDRAGKTVQRKQTDSIGVVQAKRHQPENILLPPAQNPQEICEQIPVPVMTVSEKCPTVKIQIGETVAEIPEGTSEQTITSVIRAIQNA